MAFRLQDVLWYSGHARRDTNEQWIPEYDSGLINKEKAIHNWQNESFVQKNLQICVCVVPSRANWSPCHPFLSELKWLQDLKLDRWIHHFWKFHSFCLRICIFCSNFGRRLGFTPQHNPPKANSPEITFARCSICARALKFYKQNRRCLIMSIFTLTIMSKLP